MAEYLPQLETTLMFGVGAAFDFHAGRVRRRRAGCSARAWNGFTALPRASPAGAALPGEQSALPLAAYAERLGLRNIRLKHPHPLRSSPPFIHPIMKKVLVCGAGDFTGGHLIADLRRKRHTRLRAVDKNPLTGRYQRFDDAENFQLNLELCPIAKKPSKAARRSR